MCTICSSIPLAHFVGNFEVYYTTQGSQGKLDAASKQQLENSFSTKDKEEVLKKILREGTDKSTKNVGKDGSSTKWVMRLPVVESGIADTFCLAPLATAKEATSPSQRARTPEVVVTEVAKSSIRAW